MDKCHIIKVERNLPSICPRITDYLPYTTKYVGCQWNDSNNPRQTAGRPAAPPPEPGKGNTHPKHADTVSIIHPASPNIAMTMYVVITLLYGNAVI